MDGALQPWEEGNINNPEFDLISLGKTARRKVNSSPVSAVFSGAS